MGKDIYGRELGKGITQRQDGRYQARFVNRFGKRQCVYALSLSELDEKFSTAKALNAKKANLKDGIKIELLFDAWMASRTGIKSTTRARYINIYNSVLAELIGQKDVSTLTYAMVVCILNSCKSYSTKKTVKTILSGIFKTGIVMDYCNKDYAALIEIPSAEQQVDKIALTDDQISLFLKAAKCSRWEQLYIIGFETGMRISELAGLTWDCVDFENNTITINKQIVYYLGEEHKYIFEELAPKSKSGIRVIPMTSRCKDAFLRWQKKHVSSPEFPDLVFVTNRNNPISAKNIADCMDRVCNKIMDFPHISPHTLRHTFATNCVNKGMRPELLKLILGHADISITLNIYYHTSTNNNTEILECMENLYV